MITRRCRFVTRLRFASIPARTPSLLSHETLDAYAGVGNPVRALHSDFVVVCVLRSDLRLRLSALTGLVQASISSLHHDVKQETRNNYKTLMLNKQPGFARLFYFLLLFSFICFCNLIFSILYLTGDIPPGILHRTNPAILFPVFQFMLGPSPEPVNDIHCP